MKGTQKNMPAKMTFEGFLKRYCAELSGENTSSMRKLCAAAASAAPRVTEPLFLLALEKNKLEYLMHLCQELPLYSEFSKLVDSARKFPDAESFASSEEAPKRYRAVVDAYHAGENLFAADRRIIALMRGKTLDSLNQSGLTKYRLSKDLGINKGNLYAYLNGDDSKVSRATARKILEHAQAYGDQIESNIHRMHDSH